MTRHTRRTRNPRGCGALGTSRARVRATGALVSLLSVVFALIRLASWAGRDEPRPRAGRTVAPEPEEPQREERPRDAREEHGGEPTQPRRASRALEPRRLGSALVFATLFCGGAALAAVAGDAAGTRIGTDVVPACADAIPPDESWESPEPVDPCVIPPPETGAPSQEAPTDADPAQPQPAPTAPPPAAGEPLPSTPSPPAAAAPPAADPVPPPPAAAPGPAPASASGGSGASKGSPAASLLDEGRPLAAPTAIDPEAGRSVGVVWLHRQLPDPLSRTRRLSPSFARELVSVSRRARVGWALVLGVLRAEGRTGRAPAETPELRRVAALLAGTAGGAAPRRPWLAALAYSGRTGFADRAVALARLHRAIGLRGLVVGLQAAKPVLVRKVLGDDKIEIYGGGRSDVEAGRVNIRVLVLLRYLRFAHGSVTVSSLVSGHRPFSRPGVVSAHVYGLAADVTALGGVPVVGNQEPHGLTERAVRNILLLPPELAPQQVISLLGLGGSSFALADHGDHIHVGY